MRKALTWGFITREEQLTRNSASGRVLRWDTSVFVPELALATVVVVHKLLEFLEGKGAVGLDILNTFHDELLPQSCICLAFFLTMHVAGTSIAVNQ